MTAQPADDYDVSTREGFLRRAVDITDRRIPPRYRNAVASVPEVAAWCQAWPHQADPAGLLILGKTGVGKTYQAYGALRTLATDGVTVDWAAETESDLLARLRPREGVDTETEFARFADADLLLLDDIGTEKTTEWTEKTIYRLINRRSVAITPCLITSNVPLSDLRRVLGDRVASRLTEMCKRVVLKGEDRRRAQS